MRRLELHLDCLLSPHNQDMGLRNSRSSAAAGLKSTADLTKEGAERYVKDFLEGGGGDWTGTTSHRSGSPIPRSTKFERKLPS
jgi:hypothetical protein